MKALWLKSGVVASTAVWSMAALAASSASTLPSSPALSGKSTAASAQVEAPAAKKLPISVNSLHIYMGPGLGDISAPNSPDMAVDAKDVQYIRNQVSVSYELAPKTKITPVLDFDLITRSNNENNAAGDRFRMRDAFVKLSRGSLLEGSVMGNAVALDGDVRWYVPTSKGSRDNDQIGATRLSLNPSVQFGKSPWSISAVNYARYYVQSKDLNAKGGALSQWLLYTGPQVNYAFSEKVTAFVLYEAAVLFNTKGIPDSATPGNSNLDVSPGVNLTLHERLDLTPALLWYTNQRLNTTAAQLTASIKLL